MLPQLSQIPANEDAPMAGPVTSLPIGNLLESHEARLQRLEVTSTELVAATAANGTKLENIANTLQGIDRKLDTHVSALDSHKTDDAGVAQRVHDLEVKDVAKEKSNTNRQYFLWTALAGIAATVGADILVKFWEFQSHAATQAALAAMQQATGVRH